MEYTCLTHSPLFTYYVLVLVISRINIELRSFILGIQPFWEGQFYFTGNWRFYAIDNGNEMGEMTENRWAVSGDTILLYYSGNTVMYTLTIVNSTTLSWNDGTYRKQ